MLNAQTLVTTLGISMAFFASLFWVTFFMQDIQQLSALNVGIRLLPQAVTGLVLSPVVGWWMHKVDNMLNLVAAATFQAGAGVLLLCLRPDSHYFTFLFPSLILSTLGMDWVRNVGAVSSPLVPMAYCVWCVRTIDLLSGTDTAIYPANTAL